MTRGFPFDPKVTQAQFPEGSIVVKVQAATLTPGEWPPLTGSSVAYVYRPTTASLLDTRSTKAQVIPVYFSQMAVKIKDTVAAPEMGWVFVAFTYDRNATGVTVWDKAVPVGAMWGNDPQFARRSSGRGPNNEPLRETWINA